MTPPDLPASELPELPEPEGSMNWTRSAGVCINPEPGFDADQMRDYARAALRAESGWVRVPRELLKEAADNAEASTVEDGITEFRREYRQDLTRRLRTALPDAPQEKERG